MSDWIPAPALLITILLILMFGPWVLRNFGQPRKAFLILKYGWPLLISAIAIEQYSLYFHLNKEVAGQDKVFHQFLEKAKNVPGGLDSIKNKYCGHERIAIIYRYKICLKRFYRDKSSFYLYVVEPPGYLSLIPRDYWGRDLWGTISIWSVSKTGDFEKDYRKGINNG